MLAIFFVTISQGIFVRTRFFGRGLPAVVGVDAGLLLRTLARVEYWLNFLSLLATVRGGTSFLCPTATKKRSKENAFPQSVLSVPSVQATAFGSRVARCSLEPRTLETLLLANSYIPTLRHQCSWASSIDPRTSTASPICDWWTAWSGRPFRWGRIARNMVGHPNTPEKSWNGSRQPQTTVPEITTHRIASVNLKQG